VRVEECAALEIDAWVVAGLLKYRAGRIEMKNPLTGDTGYLFYLLRPADQPTQLYLYVCHSNAGGEGNWTPIKLVSTPQNYGGSRWRFVCPRSCGRWVRKLYFPAPRNYFACRTCHNLTYQSVQEHGSQLAALRRNPALLDAALQIGSPYAVRCVRRGDFKWQPKSYVTITELSIDSALEKLKDHEFREFHSRPPDIGNLEGWKL
jgi:hypothetical protein